jgi:glycosyltransferase involved in cell wall biosynthesis
MTDTSPLLSIVIPTRDRVKTAESLIRYALACTTDATEIVVQDCGQPDALPRAIADVIGDPRVSYAHSGQRLSMTDNWSAAARRCRGRYVMYVGDDDAFSSDLEDAVRWMSNERVEALACAEPRLRYFWPDVADATVAGTFGVRTYTGRVERFDARAEFERNARSVGVGILPAVYHGIVRRDAFDRLRLGDPPAHFHGMCPDLYAAYRLATIVSAVHVVDYPLVIPGACGASNHGNTFRLRLGGYAQHFREYDRISWSPLLPLHSTRGIGQTIAEGMLRAMHDAGRDDLVDRVDLAELFVSAMRSDWVVAPVNFWRYFRAERERKRGGVEAAVRLGREFSRRTAGFVRNRIRGFVARQGASAEERARGIKNCRELGAYVATQMKLHRVQPPWSSARSGPDSPSRLSPG